MEWCDEMSVLNDMNSIKTQKSVVHFYVLGATILGLLIIIGTIIYTRLNSGNFVPSTDQFTPIHSIDISYNLEDLTNSKILQIESVVDKIGVTYASLKLDEILQSEGQFVDFDHRYMSYSFYIKNTGTEIESIDYYIWLTEVVNGLDEYIRVLVIEDDEFYQMYQKVDEPDENNNLPNYSQLPLGINFVTDTTVFRDRINDFKPGEVKSFRVIIWLEEQDPNIDDDYQSGRIETEFVFSIQQEYQVNSMENRLLSMKNENLWIPFTSNCFVRLGIYY